MAGIEWTDRSDWNPVRGCTRVSPGCGGPGDHGGCYAEAMAARFSLSAEELEAKWRADPDNAGKTPPIFKDQWGHGFAEMKGGKPRWTGKVELQQDRLLIPLSWRKPAKVFPDSASDFFHEALSDADIDQLFAIMALCPHLQFQVLTKRPARMRAYLSEPQKARDWFEVVDDDMAMAASWPHEGLVRDLPHLPNVWLGVSAERQQEADERIPLLLQTPAAVRFVSAEPLIGPIEIWPYLGNLGWQVAPGDIRAIDWVITGGESGHDARPMNPQWARDIRDQCAAAGAAFFHKQNGEFASVSEVEGPGAHHSFPDGRTVRRVGKKAAGRLLDGIEHSAFPETHP